MRFLSRLPKAAAELAPSSARITGAMPVVSSPVLQRTYSSLSSHQAARRPIPSARAVQCVQVRSITQQHRRRMREAEVLWQEQADEIESGGRESFLTMLESRGLVQNVVGDRDKLDKLLTRKRVGLYSGVDPTAPSLHIGHMIPFMILAWSYAYGYRSVWLLGGTTARYGDPTGRTDARAEMSPVTRKMNMATMHLQLKKLGVSIEKYAAKYGYERDWAWRRVVTNNNTWWLKKPFNDVLKEMGQYVRLGPMLQRDSVKLRMKSKEGMSLPEFIYPLMQAWDWWELFKNDIRIQVGGSDQEGNIRFGIDTIKHMLNAGVPVPPTEEKKYAPENRCDKHPELSKPMGLTTPLLTNTKGEKVGKSAGNGIWLDQDLTPVSDFHQHFLRISDEDVEKYLKMFTFLPLPKISEIMEAHSKKPSLGFAQETLAKEFTELIHGPLEAAKAHQQHRDLLKLRNPAAAAEASAIDVYTGPQHAPQKQSNSFNQHDHHLILPRSLIVGQFFHKVLWSAGMVDSKADGYRLICNNGAAVASRADSKHTMDDALSYIPLRPWTADVTEKFIIDNELMILRAGKWKVKIIKIVPDEEYEKLGLTAPGWDVEETPTERAKDESLVSQTGRVAGHRVKPPRIAREEGKHYSRSKNPSSRWV